MNSSLHALLLSNSIEKMFRQSLRINGYVTSKRSLSSGLPAEPANFGKAFFIYREPDKKLPLEVQNFHYMDSRILHDEMTHVYVIDGSPAKKSVTQLIESKFSQFDPDAAIQTMRNGKKWPRPEYTWPDGTEYTPEQIKRKKDAKRLHARNKGTWLHYNIERFCNGQAPSNNIPEFEQFQQFHSNVVAGWNIIPFRTEWRIAAPDLKLAGTVDFVGRILHDKMNHVYVIDGSPAKKSVTQLIESKFSQFDPDTAIQTMQNGKKWPRPEYTWPDGTEYTPEQIKRKWDAKRLQARNKGTWLHYNIERFFNGLAPSNNLPEFEQFQQFHSNVVAGWNIIPFRTEWRIAAPDLKLAGTVDFVGRMQDGRYAIIDWKRSARLEQRMSNTIRTAKSPISHLDDCEGTKYFLQLNMYRYILEQYYGINVGCMVVATFHPALDKYFMATAPVMDEEVKLLIEDFKSSG